MNNVRVTSGEYRGKALMTPGEGTHPMGSREKLALFNMISEEIAGATVLDAFAGSGALGIEALSRGAKKVVFIEKTPKAGKIIKENLAALGVSGEVFIGDVRKFTTNEKFSLILADPPYDKIKGDSRLGSGIIEKLAEFLEKGGILVLSYPEEAPVLANLELVKTRRYAAAYISVYVKK